MELKWEPIATAPKDGEQIILGFPQFSAEGYWMGNAERNHWCDIGWFFSDDDVLTAHPKNPHCWMRLPIPDWTEDAQP